MNRTKSIFLFCFLLAGFYIQNLYGQTITVSEEIYLKNDFAYDILGRMNDNLILFRDKVNKYQVQAYDESLRFRWERPIDFEKNRLDIIAVVAQDEVFDIVYGYREKGDYIIRHRRYDGTASLVDSNTIAKFDNQFFLQKFRSSRSEDRTKLLIFRTDKETEMETITYDLNEKKILWSKLLKFKNTYLRRDFRKMFVSNIGDMFMVLQHDKSLSRAKDFEIIQITASTQVVSKKLIEFKDIIAYDMFATYDNINQKVSISGLYDEKGSTTKAKGIYYVTFLKSDRRANIKLYPFSEETLQDVYGKEVSQKKGLSNFVVRDIALRQDGGAIIIAEMSKEFSRRPNVPIRREYSSYGRGAWVDYYFEDLIVLSLHPDGTEHWHEVLHKKQYSQDDDAMYSSFFMFKTPEKIRLLFNDEIRQENQVSEFVIRGNGRNERKAVFSTDYQRLRLRFKDGIQIAWNECIVPSERNNRLNLVRIRYDN
jgi:hypothetical protein